MPLMARICQQRWKSGDKAFQRCSMRIPHACPPGRATWIWHVSCGELPITSKQCICRRKHVSVNNKPYISHEQVSLPSFHQESLSTGPQKIKCTTKESLSPNVLTRHSSEVMISFRLPTQCESDKDYDMTNVTNETAFFLVANYHPLGIMFNKEILQNNGTWKSDRIFAIIVFLFI